MKPFLNILPLTAACIMLAAPMVHAQSPSYLTIGDPAPVLKPAKWIKGTPVPQFEKGKLYVVEFWATWCGPCKANIPHLTEISHKYKDKVSVIGVSIWENAKGGKKDYMPRVVDFVKEQGAAMDYIIAVDGTTSSIANSWVEPAGEKGIPCSFIVNGDGKIAWIGYPTEIDAVLEKIIAGTYDMAPVREKRETQMRLLRPIDEAVAAKNYKAVVANVEKAVAKKPELFYSQAYTYLTALYHTDLKKGIEVSRKILDESHEPGAYQMIGSIVATQHDLSPEAYKFGVSVLDEASQRWTADFMYNAMKAEAVFHLGDKAQALKIATEALGVAKSREGMSPEIIKLIEGNIEKYKAAK